MHSSQCFTSKYDDFIYLSGYMVTTVTVTVFWYVLSLGGGSIKASRGKY